LSRDELARQLKVSSSTVWRWEKGERPLPPYLELALETLERRIKEQG
jgi:DNA-binding transcriptional regulator YiaG